MNGKIDHERYVTPEALATDLSLTAAHELEQLEGWAEDLKAGLRASTESMTSTDPGNTGALLQRVMACLELLRVAQRPDPEQ